MGREEGGRFKMGNTCIPVADSFGFVWQNQYNIVKLKNKIKLKKKTGTKIWKCLKKKSTQLNGFHSLQASSNMSNRLDLKKYLFDVEHLLSLC